MGLLSNAHLPIEKADVDGRYAQRAMMYYTFLFRATFFLPGVGLGRRLSGGHL